MTKDEALKLALKRLEYWYDHADILEDGQAIIAIKEALAQRSFDYKEHAEGLQRDYDLLLAEYNDLKAQRKPLSEEEIGAILEDVNAYGTRLYTFARAIEAAHGIGEKK